MIEKLLKQLGFNPKEIIVYLAILKHGKITPAELAKQTGIKRPTVYSVVKELLEKGVIVDDLGAKQSFLLARPPENLENSIRNDEQRVREKRKIIGQAIAELELITKQTPYSIPKIQFVFENDLENFLYKQAVLWNESIILRDQIWWGFQDPSFVEKYSEWIDWYWKKSAPNDISLKLLTNKAPIEDDMKKLNFERRVVKFWQNAGQFTATTWVCGDYLIMVMTAQNPHYLVQIYDPILAHNMRELFKSIWLHI